MEGDGVKTIWRAEWEVSVLGEVAVALETAEATPVTVVVMGVAKGEEGGGSDTVSPLSRCKQLPG